MRKITEVLRLYEAGTSKSKIKEYTGISRTTIRDYVTRAAAAGISYSDCKDISDDELCDLLFGRDKKTTSQKAQIDFANIHLEMKKKGVTLQLLWEESVEQYHDRSYSYGHFCSMYDAWKTHLRTSMRQTHKAGEKMFVDYAGMTVPIIDITTGEVKKAQVFIACLGASNYTYAEATWTQTREDWLSSHRKAFEYFGGVTDIVVPDNLKTGISKPCRYEPDTNFAYQELAKHYGTAVMPARVRAPKDKAKVEKAVQVVEMWILARLRKRTFFSLSELNTAITELLEILNNRPFKKMPGTRESWFEELDKPALKPLPEKPYVYADWKRAGVNIDDHIEAESYYYSVPYKFVGQKVEVKITRDMVSIYKGCKEIAVHPRNYSQYQRYTTLPEHMPRSHREYGEWTPERIINRASGVGNNTGEYVKQLIASKPHPAVGYRAALGIIRLGDKYGRERLETATARAVQFKVYRYSIIKGILEKGLDQYRSEQTTQKSLPQEHPNIRGAQSFISKQEVLINVH